MYWNFTDIDRLVKALQIAEKPGLLKNFLHELLTKKELKAAMMRFRAMCLLSDGASYSDIQKLTGLSSRTIARISKKILTFDSASQKIIRKFRSLGKTYYE